jgi:hypothetical protein
VADSITQRLAKLTRFDFEALVAEFERAGVRGADSGDIARRWQEVAHYTNKLGSDESDDGHRDATWQRFSDAGLFGGSQGFGFEASTGVSQGPDKLLKTLQGLGEGFQRL